MKNQTDIGRAMVAIAALADKAESECFIDWLALGAMKKILHWVNDNECCSRDIDELINSVPITAVES